MGKDLHPDGLTVGHCRPDKKDPVSDFARVYKFKFDLQPGSLTDQVAGEHQPSYKHP